MSTTTQPPKPKRRWYQFSLLTLLVVMVLSCFVFAWIGSRMRQAQENRERVAAVDKAVAVIERLGGKVTLKYEERRPRTWLEKQFDDPRPPDDPVRIVNVKVVNLVISDAEVWNTLKVLAPLDLNGRRLTRQDLENLKGPADRARLNRVRIEAVEQAVAAIGKLGGKVTSEYEDIRPQSWAERLLDDPGSAGDPAGELKVTVVDFGGTRVTDVDLEHLKGLDEYSAPVPEWDPSHRRWD